MVVAGLQQLVVLVLTVLAFGLEVFALIDATRHSAAAYQVAGKLTKKLWLVMLGVATAFGFVSLPPPIGAGFIPSFGFLSIVAVVVAGVYLADVRPAVRQVRGGGSSGPYGPW